MPFTPFHFGVHACVALSFRKKLDLPTFLLANVIVDIEPLLVMVFNFNYPLHGYAHTFFAGLVLSPLLGVTVYLLRKPFTKIMQLLRLSYSPSFKVAIISAFLGHCLHVFLDAFMYPDIKPFYPSVSNPLRGIRYAGSVLLKTCIYSAPCFSSLLF